MRDFTLCSVATSTAEIPGIDRTSSLWRSSAVRGYELEEVSNATALYQLHNAGVVCRSSSLPTINLTNYDNDDCYSTSQSSTALENSLSKPELYSALAAPVTCDSQNSSGEV